MCGVCGVMGEMGVGVASGASMYRRRGSGRGGCARGGARAAAGMYRPWKRVMSSACVSTRAGGAARGRGRRRGPHRDVVFGGGVSGRTRGPHHEGLASPSIVPLARAQAPGLSLPKPVTKGSSTQFHIHGQPVPILSGS